MLNINYFWSYLQNNNINTVFVVPGGAITDIL